MRTAVDTNVIVALWDRDRALSQAAQSALDDALGRGGLVLSAPVFAELLAAPGRNAAFLDSFVRDTGVIVDWNFEQAVWRAAGMAFQSYVVRRRRQASAEPRRILADFLIGAHAAARGYDLLTLDSGLYRAAFPKLRILSV